MALRYRMICPGCGTRIPRWRPPATWKLGRCLNCGIGIRVSETRGVWLILTISLPIVLAIVTLPWWMALLAALMFTLLVAWLEPYMIVYERTTEGKQCHDCGYDLKGLTSGRCPECGRSISG